MYEICPRTDGNLHERRILNNEQRMVNSEWQITKRLHPKTFRYSLFTIRHSVVHAYTKASVSRCDVSLASSTVNVCVS